MNVEEFITNELRTIAESEIKGSFNKEQIPIVIEKVNRFLTETETIVNYEEPLTTLQNDEHLSSLKSFKWHVEQIVKINKCYGNLFDLPSDIIIKSDIKNVNELIQIQPGNKLLHYFWVIYNFESLIAEESFIRDMATFYNTIFERYSFLIELDDFFQVTDLLHPIYSIENDEGNVFVPVFEKAVEKYPQKLALKKILALTFFKNQNYKSSVEIYTTICEKYESNKGIKDDDFWGFDYIEAMQYIALNYEKLGEIDKVPYYVNYVLENLPLFSKSEGEENQKNIFSHIDSFFLRMRINLRKGEYQKVKEDYQAVEAFLDIDPQHWYDEYGDVLNQINRI